MLNIKFEEQDGSITLKQFDEGIPIPETPLGIFPIHAAGKTAWRAVHIPSGSLMGRYGWSTEAFATECLSTWFKSLDINSQELLKIADPDIVCMAIPADIMRLYKSADAVYVLNTSEASIVNSAMGNKSPDC